MTNNNSKKYKDIYGNTVPRCSTIAGFAGSKEGLIRWAANNGPDALVKRDKAAKDGDYVHYILEIDTYKAKESEEKIKESSLEAFLVAEKAKKEWKEWLQGTAAEIMEAEYMMIDSRYGWGGTTDNILYIPDSVEYMGVFYPKGYYIGDYKTGRSVYASHLIQCGGYKTGVFAMGEYSLEEQKKLRTQNPGHTIVFTSYNIKGGILFHIHKENLNKERCLEPVFIDDETLQKSEDLFLDILSVYKEYKKIEKFLTLKTKKDRSKA